MKNLKPSLVLLLLSLLFVALSNPAIAGKKKIIFGTSEPDAKIYIDGQLMGNGQVEVIVLSNSCVTVRAEKVGFLNVTINFCNKKGSAVPPKSYYAQMQPDDAYDASVQTDIANIDIEIKTSLEEIQAWKLLSQIITTHFDVIEITDRETGYLRTSWVVQSFMQNTIRTRIIVKLGNSNPLAYKVKLVSEESRVPGTSVKSDELYREWDRVLRKYENIIGEMRARLQ
ncbi:MAG: hypothetical protein DRI97_09995 [Bacteroidetes bacterium]|nr:MAG: hypothetical protein DRI83_05720 [Bacteroidota bacterium]RLD55197.1 MAG: hypothetical protein DRI97_09995 [Bacteroidota bacterium]RLD80905.1 MAG: hypothetical protein DRJ15_05855 [Bacteroidota bacterium]